MFDNNSSGQNNLVPFEGDPRDSAFSSHRTRGRVPFKIGDPEIISALFRAGVGGPTIFSLVWGWDIGHSVPGARFPNELTQTVLAIEEHIKKKEEAHDMAECKLHDIILDLLQIIYEKQVDDIVDNI